MESAKDLDDAQFQAAAIASRHVLIAADRRTLSKQFAAPRNSTRKIAIDICVHAMSARHSPSAAARRCVQISRVMR
jgi:tRNA threonylcarbamoyladenosine modification (KEOPS) complex Cgi121 subunit